MASRDNKTQNASEILLCITLERFPAPCVLVFTLVTTGTQGQQAMQSCKQQPASSGALQDF